MKNLFQREAMNEILSRIDRLSPQSQRQWGKMDVAQMLAHCVVSMEVATDQKYLPWMFIGKVLGRFFKSNFVDEKPFKKNNPTHSTFIMTGQHDFAAEKERLKNLVRQFTEGGEVKCTKHPHAFFGPLTEMEWATGMYKHLDHHLRQFGA
ncbi:DUF1569 domain-containing protein [bacterium]|nr:DUF1569 domain-containing protein [bacterium]